MSGVLPTPLPVAVQLCLQDLHLPKLAHSRAQLLGCGWQPFGGQQSCASGHRCWLHRLLGKSPHLQQSLTDWPCPAPHICSTTRCWGQITQLHA